MESDLVMRNKISQCICSAVAVVNQTLKNKLPVNKETDCPLYADGALDSISLVTLISIIEQDIEDTFKMSIILANEKAMSMRNSPFLTVGSLAEYIEQLLKESNHD